MIFSSLIKLSSFFDEFIFETAMQIHELIKTERLKAGLTEDQIAEKLEIPRATYQNWEKKPPSVEKIRAVARVLNLSKDYFFINSDEETGENDETPSIVQEPPAQYERSPVVKKGDFLQALIEEKDKAIRKAEEFAEKMESHYEDMKVEKAELIKTLNKNQIILDKAQDAILEVLKPIKEQTAEILINSKQTADHLAEFANEVRVEHRVLMDVADKAAGQQIGTSRAAAGNAELIVQQKRSGKGSLHAKVGKTSK